MIRGGGRCINNTGDDIHLIHIPRYYKLILLAGLAKKIEVSSSWWTRCLLRWRMRWWQIKTISHRCMFPFYCNICYWIDTSFIIAPLRKHLIEILSSPLLGGWWIYIWQIHDRPVFYIPFLLNLREASRSLLKAGLLETKQSSRRKTTLDDKHSSHRVCCVGLMKSYLSSARLISRQYPIFGVLYGNTQL